jgi:xanthosine utilization system XapX-like protein
LNTHTEHEQEEYTEDPIDDFDEEIDEGEELEPRPALVINVQTWATPIIALVMLVIGLVGGYLLYPEVSTRIAGTAPVAAAPAANPAAGPQSSAAGNQPDQASREEMMEFLISQTRHFKGNPDAEVTIIEFGDFQ